ncbi:polysaccharide biosynthesis/export family protein [Armatimonas sp.]|uniref:polysaccharide biosynthesis/export family protein n=1 Tax=Armatimonas sp. TaxID=1872638 RepID=UPI003751B6EF
MKMRTKQVRNILGVLGCVALSQSAWALGPVPGGIVVSLVLGQQTRRVTVPAAQERPLILPSPTEAIAALPTRYKVRCGDSLEIKVMGRPELTQAITVAPDGTMIYPYVGELEIAGNTLQQVKSKLEIGLKRQIVNPQVLVSVVKRQMGSVSILGPVKEPGKRELGDDWHVLNLLSDAKGMTVEPELVTMRLVRKGGLMTLNVDPIKVFSDPALNYMLEDGDLLVIQERNKSETMVNVLGEVGKPGYVICPRDGSPLAALIAAGGSSPKAALSRATLRRGSGGTPIPVDLSNPDKIPHDLQLGPGDTLTIPANLRQVFLSGGGVLKPGAIDIPDNIQPTIYWAIQQSGGVSQESDLKSAGIIRVAPNGTPIRKTVNLEKILKNSTALGRDADEVAKLNAMLRPGDVLEVPLKGRRSGGFRFGLNELTVGLSTFLLIRQVAK